MRFKIKLDISGISLTKRAEETARQLNKILGVNNKWHDLKVKPYSCSFIMGGKQVGDKIVYQNSAYMFLNTEDEEVINKIVSNPKIEFSIETIKLYKDFNLLSVKNIVYNKSGKRVHINEETKNDFIAYVNRKYLIDIEILKIQNTFVSYKNGSYLPVTNLLINCKGSDNLQNIFDSGIGGSCAIGFGHVEPINKKL